MRSASILTPEFFAELRKLQIQMRRGSQETLSGQYRSVFRGSGMEFEEVREYVPGDEIRRIDWKVTARCSKPFIKSYREERELNVVIAIDVSRSTWTGTRVALRRELILKTTAALATIAINSGDKVGLLTFSSEVHRYRKPQKARNTTWRMLQEILDDETHQPLIGSTNFGNAIRFLGQVLKRRSVIFLLSDFLGQLDEKDLGALSRHHDLTAIVFRDPGDLDLPKCGSVRVQDPETGEIFLLDTLQSNLRARYKEISEQKEKERRNLFSRTRMDSLELNSQTPILPELVRYFHTRRSKQRHKSAERFESSHAT